MAKLMDELLLACSERVEQRWSAEDTSWDGAFPVDLQAAWPYHSSAAAMLSQGKEHSHVLVPKLETQPAIATQL